MIGSEDTKFSYFNKGLIETLVPMLLSKDLDSQVRFEALTVLNSFLFDCPKALETFKDFFQDQLVSALQSLIKELSSSVEVETRSQR